MKTKMRVSTMRLGLLAIAAGFMILFTGCQQEDLQVSQDENLVVTTNETQTRTAGPSANGHGTLTFGPLFRHFTFHARVKNDGSIDGSGVLTYTAGSLNVHFDIDCLTIDGNTAIMSGVITKWNGSPELEGLDCLFMVEDNGEGSGSDPDQITLFAYGEELEDCTFIPEFDFYPIEGGNIQVKE